MQCGGIITRLILFSRVIEQRLHARELWPDLVYPNRGLMARLGRPAPYGPGRMDADWATSAPGIPMDSFNTSAARARSPKVAQSRVSAAPEPVPGAVAKAVIVPATRAGAATLAERQQYLKE